MGESKNRWDRYLDFVTGVYTIGGIPLVCISLAGANMLMPDLVDVGSVKSVAMSAMLLVVGVSVWGIATYICFRQWQLETEIRAGERRAIMASASRQIED